VLIKYKVSEKEVNRRRDAFLLLSISLFLGSILSSMLLKFLISFSFFWCFLAILILANLGINKFFNSFLKMRIGLSKDFLVKGKDKFLIKKIKKIKIKRTIKNNIREMYFWFDDGKSIYVNGLNNFEKFEKNILSKINKDTKVINTGEPIDFDNIFFYPILGLILSFGTVYLLRLMINFSYQTIQIVLCALMIYVFLLVIYFVISKPISKRY
jgi:hypothetical protein